MTEEKDSNLDLSPPTGREGVGRQGAIVLHIESLIFASDRPLTALEITELINGAFGFMEDKTAPEQIDTLLENIVEKYSSELYPFEVRQSGGGWQFLTKKDYHKTVAQLNGEKFLKRLSGATLETLAIIAYKQPITKGEVESIRGVSSDYSVQKLLEKELIVISGRNEAMPGHPLIYNTSKTFMDYFGINSPEDLPKIKEVLATVAAEPTVIAAAEEADEAALAVSDNGELVITDHNRAEEEPVNGNSREQEPITETEGLHSENMEIKDNQEEPEGERPANGADTGKDESGEPTNGQEQSEAVKEALKAVDETGTDVDSVPEGVSEEENPAAESAEDTLPDNNKEA